MAYTRLPCNSYSITFPYCHLSFMVSPYGPRQATTFGLRLHCHLIVWIRLQTVIIQSPIAARDKPPSGHSTVLMPRTQPFYQQTGYHWLSPSYLFFIPSYIFIRTVIRRKPRHH